MPFEALKSAVESANLEKGELIPEVASEEKPMIPGFEATSAIVMAGALVIVL